MTDDDIPNEIWRLADEALTKARDKHDEVFGTSSNGISEGLWQRLVGAAAAAIYADRKRAEQDDRIGGTALDWHIVDRLMSSGYKTVSSVRNASDRDLLHIPYIGQTALKKIRDVTGY